MRWTQDGRAFRLRGRATTSSGVLATLSARRRARHRRLADRPDPWPRRCQPFYERLFADLVATATSNALRRLYGEDFLVDESLWRGKAPGRPFGLDGRDRPLEFRLLHVDRVRRQRATSSARTSGSTSPRSCSSCRRARATRTPIGRPAEPAPAHAQGPAAGRGPADAAGPQAEPGGDRGGGAGLARHRLSLFPERRRAAAGGRRSTSPCPAPEDLFGDDSLDRSRSRGWRQVDAALHDMMPANEAQLRMMLVHSLERSARRGDGDTPRAPEPPHAADRGRAGARAQAVQARRRSTVLTARPGAGHRHRGDGGVQGRAAARRRRRARR